MKSKTADDSRKLRAWLATMIAVSAALRLWLVVRGGQLFWPDEWRVMGTWVILKRPTGILNTLTQAGAGHPTHWFYTLLGIPFAVMQASCMKLSGVSLDTANVTSHIQIMAAGMVVFSIACIALVYAVTMRAGAGERAALAASFLMATSTAMFYFARHLFPYDAAMCLALLALWIGLKPGAWGRAGLVGFIAGLAFSTYNGYWALAGVVVGLHVLWSTKDWWDAVRRAAVAGIAFVAPILLLEAYCRLRGIPSFIGGMRQFAGTVTQGSFAEGWKFPALYLWDTERGTVLIWLVLIALASSLRAVRWWVGGASAVYVLLATASLAHVFVVYGRTSRGVVPFLCMAAGIGLARLPKGLALTVVSVVCLQFAVNVVPPLTQRFPPLAPGQAYPLAWRPYQYEGFTPQERAQMRAGDFTSFTDPGKSR